MIPAVFGSVTPNWTGMSPGLTWPGLGASMSSVDSGPVSGTMPGGFGLGAGPLIAGPLNTPFAIPGSISAPGLLAAIAMRRGQPHGPTSEQDVEEFIYDALELLPGADRGRSAVKQKRQRAVKAANKHRRLGRRLRRPYRSGLNSASSSTWRGVCFAPEFSKKNVCVPAADTFT
jgi:hypothetical protein